MHDISSKFLSSSICSFFAKTDEKHGYKTRSSNSGDFYINISKTNKKLTRSFTRFEAKLWNSIPAEIHQYPKKTFKNNVHEFMLPLLQTAAVYLEAPVTLKKDKKKPSGS